MTESILTDEEIDKLVKEPKTLPYNWRTNNPPARNNVEILQTVEIIGENNSTFLLKLRQNAIRNNNFCLTLAYKNIDSGKLFHLKRYDSFAEHTNKIEKESFEGFHIHTATKRYQEFGSKREDVYAQITDRFDDYENALKCLLEDCNFTVAIDPQMNLFGDSYGSN